MGQTSVLTHTPAPKTLKLTSRLRVEAGAPEGSLYVSVRAISARVNKNFDGWPSEELKKSYKTFIGRPVFVNHVNQDHNRTRGIIVDSNYIEDGDDKYIRLLIEVDAVAFPKLAEEIRSGNLDSVSMGCDVEWTRCSICENVSYSMADFCEHVLYQKGQEIDGKLVYESCHGLNFFEISFVFDPADETAVAQEVSTSRLSSVTSEAVSPEKVDTLRVEAVCPQCGDGSYDNKECKFCGHSEPVEGLGDPDLDRAQEKNREVYDDYDDREGRGVSRGLEAALGTFRLQEAREELMRRSRRQKKSDSSEDAINTLQDFLSEFGEDPEVSGEVLSTVEHSIDILRDGSPVQEAVDQIRGLEGQVSGSSDILRELAQDLESISVSHRESTPNTTSRQVTAFLRWQEEEDGIWVGTNRDGRGLAEVYQEDDEFSLILYPPRAGDQEVGLFSTLEAAQEYADDHILYSEDPLWREVATATTRQAGRKTAQEPGPDLELLQGTDEWDELMGAIYSEDEDEAQSLVVFLSEEFDLPEFGVWDAVYEQAGIDGQEVPGRFSKVLESAVDSITIDQVGRQRYWFEEEGIGIWHYVDTTSDVPIGTVYDNKSDGGWGFSSDAHLPKPGVSLPDTDTLEEAQQKLEDYYDRVVSSYKGGVEPMSSRRRPRQGQRVTPRHRRVAKTERVAGVRPLTSRKRRTAGWTNDNGTWVLEDASDSLQGLVFENGPEDFHAYSYDRDGEESFVGTFEDVEGAKSAVESAAERGITPITSARSWKGLLRVAQNNSGRNESRQVERMAEKVSQESGQKVSRILQEVSKVAELRRWSRITRNRVDRLSQRVAEVERLPEGTTSRLVRSVAQDRGTTGTQVLESPSRYSSRKRWSRVTESRLRRYREAQASTTPRQGGRLKTAQPHWVNSPEFRAFQNLSPSELDDPDVFERLRDEFLKKFPDVGEWELLDWIAGMGTTSSRRSSLRAKLRRRAEDNKDDLPEEFIENQAPEFKSDDENDTPDSVTDETDSDDASEKESKVRRQKKAYADSTNVVDMINWVKDPSWAAGEFEPGTWFPEATDDWLGEQYANEGTLWFAQEDGYWGLYIHTSRGPMSDEYTEEEGNEGSLEAAKAAVERSIVENFQERLDELFQERADEEEWMRNNSSVRASSQRRQRVSPKTASAKSVMMLVEAYLDAGLTTEDKKWSTYSELERVSQEKVDDRLNLLTQLRETREASVETPRGTVPRTARRRTRPTLSLAQRSSTGTPHVDDSLLFS